MGKRSFPWLAIATLCLGQAFASPAAEALDKRLAVPARNPVVTTPARPDVILTQPSNEQPSSEASQPAAQTPGCTPDLRVRRVEIDPPYPRAGQPYRIKVWALQFLPEGQPAPESFVAVRLLGHTTAIDSQYASFADSDSYVTPDFSMSRTEWQAKSLEVYIRLDHRNAVRECREDNNEYTHRYTVYAADEPMANLAFKGYIKYKPGQLINRDVAMWGEIVNKGNGESRPFWLEFDCEDNRDAKTRKIHRMRVAQLIPAGGVIAFNTAMRWDNPGMKVCKVRLDPEDEVIESSEYDNEDTTLTLRIDTPPPVK